MKGQKAVQDPPKKLRQQDQPSTQMRVWQTTLSIRAFSDLASVLAATRTGRTETPRGRLGQPHPGRDQSRRTGQRRTVQRRHRPPSAVLGPHRASPSDPHLRQARHRQPDRTGRTDNKSTRLIEAERAVKGSGDVLVAHAANRRCRWSPEEVVLAHWERGGRKESGANDRLADVVAVAITERAEGSGLIAKGAPSIGVIVAPRAWGRDRRGRA